ncbi:efflux RND transporter periplasmic adaptor subunit [Ideonella sp. YS5]|uniref:efflux RND transporter periplasmic adaptor subunit n=1 Tax=Ideonella sp. YS5 TaxID=3453714 RepID=UPI003EEA2F79
MFPDRLSAALAGAAVISFALSMAACSADAPPTATAPRPVKVEAAGEGAAATPETFIGTARARQRAELGFEAGGRLAALMVDVGDRVRAGQVLARLESAPARWRQDKALADRAAATAALAERETQLRQHEALAKDGIISSTALESVRTQQQLAASQLQGADAVLALAQRELALASITAPFDGEIVARAAQAHADVAPGQVILQLESPASLEVIVMLPEAVAARLAPGQLAAATVSPPAGDGRPLPLRLARLSPRSENGSLMQAVFEVTARGAALHSGSVVAVELPQPAVAQLSLPAAAVLPGRQRSAGSVMVLDVAKGRVEKRQVTLGGSVLPGGRVPVTKGLTQGELVVVAGAAFLTDGEAAVRLPQQTLLSEAR